MDFKINKLFLTLRTEVRGRLELRPPWEVDVLAAAQDQASCPHSVGESNMGQSHYHLLLCGMGGSQRAMTQPIAPVSSTSLRN